MRFIPGYDWRAVETIPAPRITWRSQSWDVVKVTLGRTIGGPMIDGWADMIQAEAEVVMWSPDADVETDQLNLPHPDRVMPRRGEYMDVYLGDNRGQLRCLRGRVLDVSVPSARSPELSVTLGDFVSRFDYPTTMGPLGYRHPTLTLGDPDVRYALHTTGIVDRIFRDSGFYATPPMIEGAVVSVPLVGDAVPERGNLVASSLTEAGPGQVSPVHTVGPWGPAVMNLHHRYSMTPHKGTFFVTGLMNVPSQPTSRSTVRMHSDKGDLLIRLGRASIVVESSAGETLGAVYTADLAEQELHWAVWVGDNGGVIVQVGNSVQETLGTLPSLGGATWSGVTVGTPARGGVQVAGIQVVPRPGTISNRWRVPVGFDRTAIIQSSAGHGVLLGRPAIVGRNALNLLKEIAQAERAAVWVDEDGRAHWRARSRLFSSPYTAITADEAMDLSWHGMWQASRDRVQVAYKRPSLKLSPWAHFTLWSASPTLGLGDLFEEFIGPGADEDWLHVDAAIPILSYAVGATGEQSRRDARNRRRSFWTGVVQTIDAAEGSPAGDWVAFASSGTAYATQLAPDRWLVHADAYYRSAGEFGLASNQELRFQVPDPDDFAEGSSSRSAAAKVDPALHGEDGLVVRGKGVQSWHDETYTVGTARDAGIVEHDAGHWIQTGSEAQKIGDFLHSFHTQDRPVWQDVPVHPDVRRQVGDIVRFEIGPIQHRAMILSIRDEATPGSWAQSLTLQSIGEMTDA